MSCGTGGFGAGPFGSSPFGSGSALSLDTAREERTNAVLATFTVAPEASDPATAWDALNPDNWLVVGVTPDGAIVRLVQDVERVDAYTMRVLFDGPLTGPGSYQLVVSSALRALGGGSIGSCRSALFDTFGVTRSQNATAAELPKHADLANPQDRGTFQRNSQGDLAIDSGRANLKKRILRRAMTVAGSFFHLPGYGFAPGLKSNITAQLMRRLQADAQGQVIREPDVRSCTAIVSRVPSDPGLVILTLKVIDTNGDAFPVTVPVRIFVP